MDALFPIEIIGTASYVPDKVLDNQHFAEYLETDDEWIVSRTGIRERRQAAPDQATSDLGLMAAKGAIKDAGLQSEEIDLIICATATGDHQFPATATMIQDGLTSKPIPAFDVGAACAGFLYATSIAVGQIASGAFKNVLVVGAETLTRFSDREDRTTCVLFGDAAGAAVFTRSKVPTRGVLHMELGCDGSRKDLIWVPAGGSRMPASANSVAERLHFLRMRGREVYKFAVVKMQELIDRGLTHAGLSADDVKLLIPHQSNLRIIELVRQKMGLPADKVSINIDRFGNTSSASIPMALDEARRSGRVKEGDVVMLIALGAGLSWATIMLRL